MLPWASRGAGWTLGILLWGIGVELAAQPVPDEPDRLQSDVPIAPWPAQADFAGEQASGDVQQLADWVLHSDDNRGLPFVLVDKPHARVLVFNSAGRLLGATPALLGLARGDDSVAGIGERRLSSIQPDERTTPAGRFVAGLAYNLSGQQILWVDYDLGISLHPVRSSNPKERRLQRLASPSALDNRISYGCINVPAVFFQAVVMPLFMATPGMVYVLPETRPLQSVFAIGAFKSGLQHPTR